MAYYEYFSGTATQVSRSTIGSIGNITSSGSSAMSLMLGIKEWEFKINGQMFKTTTCSGLLEEGDKVAVAAHNNNNGYYSAIVIRNYTKNYRKPSTFYVIGTAIGLCLLSLVFSIFFAVPIGNLVGSIGNTYLVFAVSIILVISYFAINTLRAIKTLQNMPPPLIHNIMRLFWGNAPKSAICL